MSQMLIEAQEAPEKIRSFLSIDGEIYSDLGQRLRRLNPSVVATFARGSSDHGANYASYLIPLCTGRPVASIPPSLKTVLNAPLNLKKQFVLALSQGGGSPDIVSSVQGARDGGALTAAIVNVADSPLAKTAEVLLAQHMGPEKSITATKSVLGTLTAIVRLTSQWAEDQSLKQALVSLPNELTAALDLGLKANDQILKGVSHVYVISRGLGLSCALEVALKLKETCGIHAEGLSAAELRHGPREVVDRNFLVIALALPGSGQEDVIKAAAEMKSQGARILLVTTQNAAQSAVSSNDGFEVLTLPSSLDFRLAPITTLQLLYPWLARCSKALGHDPDHPKNLKAKVIKTV